MLGNRLFRIITITFNLHLLTNTEETSRMTVFEKEGFLTDNPCNIKQAIEQQHSQIKQLSLEINRYAQSYQYQLQPNQLAQVELLATGLYARSLATYQGVITLANSGMKHQSHMLVRCLWESVFQLKALANEPEFIELLKMQGLRHRRDAITRLVKMKNRKKENDEFYEEVIKLRKKTRKDVDKNRNKFNSTELSIFTTAKKAGMEDYYDTLYAMGSTVIHSGILSIEEHFVIDTDNLVQELKNEPSLDDYSDTIYAACDVLLNGILALDKIYNRSQNQQVYDFIERLNTVISQRDD